MIHRLLAIASRYFLLFVVFFVISSVFHYKGLSVPMLYDSKVWVADKAHIFLEGDLLRIFSIFPERPLFMLILYVNYLCFGMEPYLFRLVGSGLCAAAGVSLVFLTNAIFHLPSLQLPGSETQKYRVSVFLGLLFVAHPLQTFVVLYIWQGQVLLACLFYFSALAAYLAGAGGRFGAPLKWYVLCAMLFFSGLVSKENTSTLPAAMLLAEVTLLCRDVRQTVRRALVIGAITVPCLAVYLLLAYNLHGAESVIAQGVIVRIKQYYVAGGWSPIQVALTECRVFFIYVASVIAPFAVQLHLVKAMLLSDSVLEPIWTLPAVVGFACWIATALALIRRTPVVAFGMLFFVIALIPESALIPQFLFFGYRPILSMAGILLIVGHIALKFVVWGELKLPRRVREGAIAAAAVIPIAGLGCLTWAEATNWTPLKVWEKAYLGSPNWSRYVEQHLYTNILVNYGAELVNSGQYAAAAPILSRAIELDPNSASAYNNLGNAMMGMGKFSEAIDVFQRAIQTNHKTPELFLNLGAALLKTRRTIDAKESFAKAVEINPGFAKAQANLGMLCLQMGEIPEALEHLGQAVKINPGLALAQSRLGRACELAGDYSRAAEHYTKALSLSPRLVEAHFGLGNTMAWLKDNAAAIEHYKRALASDPRHFMAENNLGLVLLSMSEFSEAAQHFRRALEIRPDFFEAKTNLEMALQKSGDTNH
jgi:protein O-mannosyl-transferase